MNCKELYKSVIEFIEKELTADKENEFKEHIKVCKECLRLFSSVAETYSNLNIKKEIETKAFFTESVINKIYNEKVKESIFDLTVEIAISGFFKKFAYTGVAFIIVLFILLYTTDNLFLFNNVAEDDNFTANRISSLFFDNN